MLLFPRSDASEALLKSYAQRLPFVEVMLEHA